MRGGEAQRDVKHSWSFVWCDVKV